MKLGEVVWLEELRGWLLEIMWCFEIFYVGMNWIGCEGIFLVVWFICMVFLFYLMRLNLSIGLLVLLV